jgi:hypothetical protein
MEAFSKISNRSSASVGSSHSDNVGSLLLSPQKDEVGVPSCTVWKDAVKSLVDSVWSEDLFSVEVVGDEDMKGSNEDEEVEVACFAAFFQECDGEHKAVEGLKLTEISFLCCRRMWDEDGDDAVAFVAATTFR